MSVGGQVAVRGLQPRLQAVASQKDNLPFAGGGGPALQKGHEGGYRRLNECQLVCELYFSMCSFHYGTLGRLFVVQAYKYDLFCIFHKRADQVKA